MTVQRGQRERHERRDPVPHREAEGRVGADLGHGADEHAAGPRHGVLHLAALGDDREHLGADGIAVARVLLGELAEGRRVEVEGLDVDPHLVGPQLRAGVEDAGGLGQRRPGGVEHPVQPTGERRGGAHKNLLTMRHAPEYLPVWA